MKKLSLHVTIWSFLALLMSGCLNSPSVSEIVINQNLPVITQIRTLSSMDSVGLEWSPEYGENIQGYHIYKSDTQTPKLKRLATIKDKYSTHYVDEKVKPNTSYQYTISTYSVSGEESQTSKIITVKTKQTYEAVPFVQALTGLPNRSKIIWRPHPNPAIVKYDVERSIANNQSWRRVSTVYGRLNAEYIDTSVDENEIYHYRVIAKDSNNIASKTSQEVTSHTKPLPPRVQNIQASHDKPKKILIQWEHQKEEMISYYKVYSSLTSRFLFTYLAKTTDTHFEDFINSNGAVRYYKVTAVDKDGLESYKPDKSVEGSTIPSPKSPENFEANSDAGMVTLSWSKNNDADLHYTVIKKFNGNTTAIKDIRGTSHIDTDVISGNTYEYKVIAIDSFGLTSDASNSKTITIP